LRPRPNCTIESKFEECQPFSEVKLGHRRDQDHWGRKARSEGYSARSAYKLEEIQKRFSPIPRNGKVVDLGCAPGSWAEFIHRYWGVNSRIVGVDIGEAPGYLGQLLTASVFDVEPDALLAVLGAPADLLLSDMAPSTTGSRFTDHVRQIELAERARVLAASVLRPGGHFIAKVFDGEDAPDFVQRVRGDYTGTKRFKPKATRSESVEFYVIGMGRLSASD
jgi:23S rRNA (uridine2552-2'-O)-methyltransferase